jgi:hypothetical protein
LLRFDSPLSDDRRHCSITPPLMSSSGISPKAGNKCAFSDDR